VIVDRAEHRCQVSRLGHRDAIGIHTTHGRRSVCVSPQDRCTPPENAHVQAQPTSLNVTSNRTASSALVAGGGL
jgi:hypothetical protein